MDAKLFNHSQTLRASVLRGLSLFLCFIALSMAVFNVAYHQALGLASIEVLFSGYSFYVHQYAKQNDYSERHAQSYVCVLLTIIVLATYLQPISHGTFIWGLLAPVVLYVFLGQKLGGVITGMIVVIISCLLFIQLPYSSYPNAIPILINFSFCYSGLWFIAHIYESNRHKIEFTLTHLATRDPLTGAHNRLSLHSAFDYFEQNKSANTSLCLLIIDLDYFKQINDQFGHDTGDKVLVETCRLFAQHVGEKNLFRIGGEEFCITLFDHSLLQAEQIGERLRNLVANYSFSKQQTIQLTLSVGICEYRSGDNLNDLIKLADMELYKAKKNGRNQVCICQTSASEDYTELSQADSI